MRPREGATSTLRTGRSFTVSATPFCVVRSGDIGDPCFPGARQDHDDHRLTLLPTSYGLI
jgi:hypothetical protein